jgi:hypothetical protein
MNSQADEDAVDKADAAYHVFEPIRQAYRARKIGDAEFLAAKAIYDAANREYDAAYIAEQNRAA